MSLHRAAYPSRRQAGFSLVEVMVALVVISVGLLGIAKMQALALSSTTSARSRSLAALQAASLAATMHADRTYWSGITATLSVTATGGAFTVASGDPALTAPTGAQAGCTSIASPCTPVLLAGQDLKDWATALNAALPGSNAAITCNIASATDPVSCRIQINWTENLVQLNTAANTAAGASAVASAVQNVEGITYMLFVDP